ncbi:MULTISPECIES: hypothetical protein [unclassified Kribbella]|uniref:hypothetical protein n=1 Tax=unclassified Kribbella TaxID=2644121 RepID=UPI0030199386
MSYFDIEGYQPRWLNGRRAVADAHGRRLGALVGRRLDRVWLVWDRGADEWFAFGPVLLDFGGEQVEVNHQKFSDLSITWNTVDPVGQATWSNGDDDPEVYTFHLGWRHDARPELAVLEGRQLTAVELLEWTGGDVADGMVAVSFVFADERMTISNALDENALELGAPHHSYRTHPLH